jgi:hypothetical protein
MAIASVLILCKISGTCDSLYISTCWVQVFKHPLYTDIGDGHIGPFTFDNFIVDKVVCTWSNLQILVRLVYITDIIKCIIPADIRLV